MHREGLDAIKDIVINRPAAYEAISVRPITPVIGAEIEGVDLAGELTNRQFDELHRALLDHHVIVFRDQHLSAEDHKRFARRFGALHVHPLQRMKGGDIERLEVVANANSKFVAGEGWHTDVTCDAEPPMGSLLYIKDTPEIGGQSGFGGDTMFANTYLAYDILSEPMKAFLQGLTAVHDGAIPWVQAYGVTPKGQDFACNEHPVVVRHPETGRRLLYVNRGFTSHIPQLTRFESNALLEMLYRTIETHPALTCRVRWTPNTLVFWDNRCTQHHAIWDYYPLNRAGHRVSVVGTRPAA